MLNFNVLNKFNTTLLTPVRAIRPRYIPQTPSLREGVADVAIQIDTRKSLNV